MELSRLVGMVLAATVVVLAGGMVGQVRKPGGWLGRAVAWMMNRSHAGLTAWGLERTPVAGDATVLDVGCGGGATVRCLAALAPKGRVIGLDYSAASVAVARRTNEREIAAGGVGIARGSVAELPFADRTFDLVTAVETHYYWPDLPANVREVWRVLKPGGRFVLIAETYREGSMGRLHGAVMPLLHAVLLSDEEHRDLLAQAGFLEVVTEHVRGKDWIRATGRRPA